MAAIGEVRENTVLSGGRRALMRMGRHQYEGLEEGRQMAKADRAI